MQFPGEKLIIKLWETLVDKGLGSLLSPWQAEREGRVRNNIRRQEILLLAQAEADAADIRSGKKILSPDGELLLKNWTGISERTAAQEESMLTYSAAVDFGHRTSEVIMARSELNAAKAIIFAEQLLENDLQTPPERSINEDWLFSWRECAGKVSDEDLQRFWGSVLAGEVKAPGSHSIRTLEFLKALSRQEAEMIGRLAKFEIDGCILRGHDEHLEKNGLSFSVLLQLQELGIISGVDGLGLNVSYHSAESGRFIKVFASHGKALIVEHGDVTKVLEFATYKLTMVGKEVLRLGSFQPDVEYLRSVGKNFARNGFTVKLANWVQLSENMGRYFNEEEIDDESSQAQP